MLNDKYILKIYDTDLVRFRYSLNQYGQLIFTDIENDSTYQNLLPASFLELGIEKWLEARVVPRNRQFYNEILRAIGNLAHPMHIIDRGMGFALTDSYWIVPESLNGKFADYNLFESELNQDLERVAFTGCNIKINDWLVQSPELTTNGMLRKCWRRVDNEIYLYKGSSINTCLEPYSEYYSYQIAKAMGLKAVEYDLKMYEGQLASVCKAFTDINTSYVPMSYLVGKPEVKEIIKSYGHQEFADLIVFDAVICNTDRHTGNYGLLRDNRTGEYIGPAPIFDNGQSLFNYASQEDFVDIKGYSKSRLNSFGVEQILMARSIMTENQRNILKKLIGFSFSRHPRYNLPEWRLKGLESYIQARVNELLSNDK